jgi:hypothetical protein
MKTMKELNKTQNIIFILGGLLMVIGAGCYSFMVKQGLACWIFLVGAVMFAIMQCMQIYEGNNFTIKRLKRIMTFADIMFVLSGLLMVDSAYKFLLPLFRDYNGSEGYYTYIEMIYNKWVVLLLIAAVLEVYTTHRISSELEKENAKKN